MTGMENIYYRLIQAVFYLLGRLPEKWRNRLGNGLGLIWFQLDKRHRNVAISNLSAAYKHEKTPEDIRNLALRVFQNIGQIPFEIAWSQALEHEDLLKHFEINGISNLNAAMEKGKGVLALTGHAGNWELLPAVLSLFGFPLNAVYRPLSFKPADRYLSEYRNRFGVKLIAKKRSMRKILKTISLKEIVGVVFDQDSGRTAGIFVDFFGRKACTSKGLSLLALKTEAPVVPIFIARTGGKFHVEIGKELPLIKTGDKERDMEANTQQYNDAIEKFIRKYPEQWFWVHNRFKNQPL